MAEGRHDGMRMMGRDSKVMKPVAQSDSVTLLLTRLTVPHVLQSS